MEIKTQDCYLPVESDKTNFIVTQRDFTGGSKSYFILSVERHTNMVVLTVEQYNKNMKEQETKGYQEGLRQAKDLHDFFNEKQL